MLSKAQIDKLPSVSVGGRRYVEVEALKAALKASQAETEGDEDGSKQADLEGASRPRSSSRAPASGTGSV